MLRQPDRPVSFAPRMIPLGITAVLLSAAILAFLMPPAVAASVAPYFGPNVHIAVDPVNPHLVHVVWTDSRSAVTGPDIYYANSTNGGLSFNPSVRVNDDVASTEQGQPAIAVAPNRDVYVVWRDPRSPAKGPDIYFSKSSDLGWTWAPNRYVYNDPGNIVHQDPTIAA